MKKIAALLIFVFAFLQAGPILSAIFADTCYVLVIDEEKGEHKTKIEKKHTKDFLATSLLSSECTNLSNTAFQVAEKIQLSPSLEKLTPPPNFC